MILTIALLLIATPAHDADVAAVWEMDLLGTAERAGRDYDTPETSKEGPEIVGFDYRPFPDWIDSESYFTPGKRGLLVTDSELDRLGSQAAERWLQAERRRHPSIDAPVLVWFGTEPATVGGRGGVIFLINRRQRAFFQLLERMCTSCVDYLRVSELPEQERVNVEAKLEYMRTDQPQIVRDYTYDMAVWWNEPDTWDQKEPKRTLEAHVRHVYSTHPAAERGLWLAALWLTPHDLEFAKLLGPDLSIREPDPAEQPLPLWVKLAYCEWINPSVGFSCASDVVVRRMWHHIKARCPRCETWSDWRCGSGYEARLARARGLVCDLVDPDDERGLRPHSFLPGDRSVPSMQFDWPLRSVIDWDEYTRREVAEADPYEFVYNENVAHFEEINDASEAASEFYGTEWTCWTDEQIERMAERRTENIFGIRRQLIEAAGEVELGDRPDGPSVDQLIPDPEG